jgi:hypothetical protein
MKSRLAVSILFILIAASFTSDALGAFEKLRSLTGNVVHRFAVEACTQISSHDAARTRNRGSNESTIKLVQLDDGRPMGNENCPTKFVATAARQVGEVFALMRLK